MSKTFQNQTAVISGGLGDIGKAISLAFAAEGAAIGLCDVHNLSEATGFLTRLKNEYGVPCYYEQVDVSEAGAVKAWLYNVKRELGIPSLIIVNAATATLANMLEITTDQWLREINVNLNGAFYMAQEAARQLVESQTGGRIVFIGSWAAHAVHLHMPAYSVSKAGIRMLSKTMALELARHNILVNEVAPGYVQAGLSGKIWEQHPELSREAAERVPTGKFISTTAVADQVLYLCRPDNVHITGSTLLMDGGLSLRS